MKPEHKKHILENRGNKSARNLSKELGIKERHVRRFLENRKEKEARVVSKLNEAQEERSKQRVPINKWALLGAVLLIIAIGFGVYLSSLNGEFILDDEYLVRDNVYIRSLSNVGQFFAGKISSDKAVVSGFRFYRPLQMLSYALDYRLCGLEVQGYHLTNVILHVLAALALFGFVVVFFKDVLLAFLTSLFFVVHPIHTEAISYISGRSDPLSALFLMLCFIFYVKWIDANKIVFFILTLVAYGCALLSREASLVMIALVPLLHFTFKRKFNPKLFLSIVGVSIGYIILRVDILPNVLASQSTTTTFFQRVPGFFTAITQYVRLMILPVDLHMEYGSKLFSMGGLQAITGFCILSAVVYYLIKRREFTNKIYYFAVIWFFVTLLPVSNLFPINAYMAEHWLYFPSIGFFLIIASVFSSYCRKQNFRYYSIVIVVLLVTWYSYLTFKQSDYWREPIVFHERTLKYDPGNWRTCIRLGHAYRKAGRKEDAVSANLKATEINPQAIQAYANLGNVYADLRKNKEAIKAYEKALAIDPNAALVYYNLALTYMREGKFDLAIEYIDKAEELGFTAPAGVSRQLDRYRKK